jgi:hypothetical protein
MADGEGSASEQVPVLLALDNLLKDRPGSDLRPDSQARLLQLINGSQIAASDAVALHALVAVQRSHNSGPDAAGFWFAEANQAFDRIQDPVDQLVALAVLARAYQAAGNQRTAERLVRRIKAGSDVLDEASPNRMRVIDRLVNAYIAIGHIDPALALVEQSASTALDVDLQRAQVAIELAAAHRFTSARGAVVLIANPVVRARAKARLSAIAALQEQLTIAQVLANEAMVEMRRLPQAEQALLASDMMPPLPAGITHLWTEEAIEKRVRHDEYPDRGWAIVATNLAWNRSGTAAEKLSLKIADEKLRKQTQQRIHELGMLFETAATIPAG